METVHRDYSPKGVQFFYVYKALAHPERNGYLKPVTLQERLMHIKEARRTLGSTIPWLCDGMDNAIKEAFGNRPNSEFIIDPQGRILVGREWSDPEALREDLARIIGPVENPTTVADLDLKTADPPKEAPSGIVPGVDRPANGRALVTKAKPGKDGEPFYIKLRAEAGRSVMDDGHGTIYLGFRLDPLYHVHWNNLVEPVQVTLTAPDGVELSKSTLKGPKVEAPTDIDPREFLVDITGAQPGTVIDVSVYYFACNDEAGWCKPVKQSYEVVIEADPHGGRVSGGRGGRGGRRGQDMAQRMQRMFEQNDANGDGKLSRDEFPERMSRMFDRIDSDGDGFVTRSEMSEMRGGRGGRGGRGRREGRDGN